MRDAVTFYKQQAAGCLSPESWLASIQSEAIAALEANGFPILKDEDWKYSSTAAFLKERFQQTERDQSLVDTKAHALVSNAYHVSICNGFVSIGTGGVSLPDGVLIMPLGDAITKQADKIKPYLGKIVSQKHGFHHLNTAMLQQGVFVYVPAHVSLDKPIVLSHKQEYSNQLSAVRCVVVAESSSDFTLIDDYQGEDAEMYFTNTVTEVYVGPKASVVHYKVQREGVKAYHVGQVSVIQDEESSFDSHLVSVGGHWVRSDINITFRQEGATCTMNGIYLPGSGQHMDFHTVVSHDVPNCKSSQDYKGILDGQARAVFNGKVIVKPNATQSEAYQQNKNLLLSRQAEVDTKPELNIFTDDVLCSHGATIGALDEEAIFYFTSRGISRENAEKKLLKAFIEDNKRSMYQKEVLTWLDTVLL